MIEKTINELVEKLKNANYNYYALNKSIMSDKEYDFNYKKLEELEKENPRFVREDSPTKYVGDFSFLINNSKFEKAEHEYKMLSLKNTYDEEDLNSFLKKIIFPVNIEVKADGISLELIYENGYFAKAITRGNGKIGEDITENARMITNIPKEIKNINKTTIRGEVVLPRTEFFKLNNERKTEGKEKYSNCRNAAGGILRNKEKEKVKGVKFLAYEIIDGLDFKSHSSNLIFLIDNYFEIVASSEVKDKQTLIEKLKKIEENKNSYSYDIDGAVIKLSNLEKRKELGATNKFPNWAVAYKFDTEKAETILKDVTYQIGKLGTITPVAELKAVELCGSVIRRSTLHNFDEIKRLGVMIKDTVIIEKAGEIIPKIISARKDLRTGKEYEIKIPELCPCCYTPLEKKKDMVAIFCPNESCQARLEGITRSMIGKKGLNINSFGEALVGQLYENGIISKPSDIFKLREKKDHLLLLNKMGEKKVENLFEGIKNSLSVPPNQVVYALQIETLGESMSESLLEHIGSFERVFELSEEELANITGDVSAKKIKSRLEKENFKELYETMKDFGYNFELIKEEKNIDEKFEGKSFCITGTLSIPRKEIENIIKSKGGTIKKGISKNLDYLLAGEKAGSKLKKAEENSVKIIGEDFLK